MNDRCPTAIAIGASEIVSIGEASIGTCSTKPLPKSVCVETSVLLRMSEYCGLSNTSSYDNALLTKPPC